MNREDIPVQRVFKRQGQSFAIGTATPKEEQVKTKSDPYAAVLSGLMDVWNRRGKDVMDSAKAAGALDASVKSDALGEYNGNPDNINVPDNIPSLLRGTYKEGYVNAGIQQQLNNFMAGTATRAEDAANKGMSDEEFLDQEKQSTSDVLSKLQNYMTLVDPKTKMAIASSVESSSQQAMGQFQRIRDQKAKQESIRNLNESAWVSANSFGNSLDSGGSFKEAYPSISNFLNQLVVNPNLSQKDKTAMAENYIKLVAERTNSPEVIEQLMNAITSDIQDVNILSTLGTTLKNLHDSTAKKYELKARMDLTDLANKIQSAPMAEQHALKKSFDDSLLWNYTTGRISAAAAMSLRNDLYKPAALKGVMAADILSRINPEDTIDSHSLAAKYDISPHKAVQAVASAIKDPITALHLMPAILRGRDPELVQPLMTTISNQLSTGLSTVGLTAGEDGTIPQTTRDLMQTLYTVYNTGDSMTRHNIAQLIPSQHKIATLSAFNNAANYDTDNLLDTIKDRQRTASEGGQIVPSSNDLRKDTTGELLGFFKWLGNWGTDWTSLKRDANRMYESTYNHVKNNKPELLMGAPSDVAKTLAGETLKLFSPVKVGSKTVHVGDPITGENFLHNDADAVTMPNGSQGINRDLYNDTLGGMVDVGLKTALGDLYNNVTSISISRDVGYNGDDYIVRAEYKDQSGNTQLLNGLTIPKGFVMDNAVGAYTSMISQEVETAKEYAGENTTYYRDKTGGGKIQALTLRGENPIGLNPHKYNKMINTIVRMNGFSSRPVNGTIGFGLKAGNSKKTTVEESLSKLSNKINTETIPAVKKDMKENGYTSDEALFALAQVKELAPQDYKSILDKFNSSVQGFNNSFTLHKIFAPNTPKEVVNLLEKKLLKAFLEEHGAVSIRRSESIYKDVF